jgi:small subunit ribosomal protein S17
MERNSRRVLVGTVVSASGDKTISVLVEGYRKHRLYGKRVKQTKKFAAHDEANLAQVGDAVRIMETRPLSKTKRFRLLEVTNKKS